MTPFVFAVPRICTKTSEIQKNFLEFQKKNFYTFEIFIIYFFNFYTFKDT